MQLKNKYISPTAKEIAIHTPVRLLSEFSGDLYFLEAEETTSSTSAIIGTY